MPLTSATECVVKISSGSMNDSGCADRVETALVGMFAERGECAIALYADDRSCRGGLDWTAVRVEVEANALVVAEDGRPAIS